MAMKFSNPLSVGKVFAGMVILAIMVSIGMVLLQRTPSPAEGFLVFIFGMFIPIVTSN